MTTPSLITDSYWVYAVNPTAKARRARFLAMWVMVIPVAEVDETWAVIEVAVAAGKLPAARARTGMLSVTGFDERYSLICIFTPSNQPDEADRVREIIRNLGIRYGLRYQSHDSGPH